jgi:hypothetical protein
MDIGRVFEQFGLLGLLIGGILTMCGLGFKWILEQFKVELEGNRKERLEYLTILHKIDNSIEEHDKRADERGKYVREEHTKMIETLNRMNGHN